MQEIHAVTGAFGYSGRYIASRLLKENLRVITLTGSVNGGATLAKNIEVFPLDFRRKEGLTKALEGVSTLYNTYWVRFNHRRFNHDEAVANSRVLFEAARTAGVERVVHISITNPAIESPLSYFRGKAEVEEALKDTGMSYAILRPAVLFGREDILINNIAWALRRMPVFGLFGDGSYRLRPIFVDDLASAAVTYGRSRESLVVDAVGPEAFTYRGLVETVAEALGVNRPIVALPARLAWSVGSVIGRMQGDVMITWDEVQGLTAGLLDVDSEPLGGSRLSEWVRAHRNNLGRRYASEMARRRDPRVSARSN